MIPKKRDTFLGEILLQAGLVTQEGLDQALSRQKETGQLLGETLVALGQLSQEDIEWALSSQYQLPLIRPGDITVDPGCRDIIPETLAREFNVAPLFRTGNELSVVVDDPLKLERLASQETFGEFELNIALGTHQDVATLIDELYGRLCVDPSEATRDPVESSRLDSKDLEHYVADYSGRSLAEMILRRSLSAHATSILLDPGAPFGEAKIRTGSTVHETYSLRSDWYRTLVRAFFAMSGDGLPTDSPPEGLHEAVGRVTIGEDEIAFSVTLVSKPDGPAAILKLPVGPPTLPKLKDLRLPDRATDQLATLLARRQGLWIVSGSPPAATSRILHTLTQAMLGPGRRFVSLREDSRGYEKLDAFRSLQVIDPMVGADRFVVPGDGEWDGIVLPSLFERREIERALRYALTGRTVVASMDFPDPRSVIRYLLCHDINVALVTSALAGVLVQKEIRVLCTHCKERIEGPGRLPVSHETTDTPQIPTFRPVGCEVCRFTGFSSQDTLLDFWAMDRSLKRILHGNEPLAALEDHGGAGLSDGCMERLRRGETVLEEVLSVCDI